MENDEIIVQVVCCEIMEEVGVSIVLDVFFVIISIVYINQVYFFYCGCLVNLIYVVGEESLEVVFVNEKDIFWQDLVFCSVVLCLKYYFEDWVNGVYGFYEVELILFVF